MCDTAMTPLRATRRTCTGAAGAFLLPWLFAATGYFSTRLGAVRSGTLGRSQRRIYAMYECGIGIKTEDCVIQLLLADLLVVLINN
jgi:hypothetical protein